MKSYKLHIIVIHWTHLECEESRSIFCKTTLFILNAFHIYLLSIYSINMSWAYKKKIKKRTSTLSNRTATSSFLCQEQTWYDNAERLTHQFLHPCPSLPLHASVHIRSTPAFFPRIFYFGKPQFSSWLESFIKNWI